MPVFDVHTFIKDCFIQQQIRLGDALILTPIKGVGSSDLATVMNHFGTEYLQQTPMPNHVLQTQASHGVEDGSTVVMSVLDVQAETIREAVESTRDTAIVVRETLALRQYTRGKIAGFYVVQTDCNPNKIYVEPRIQPVRRVYQLGPGEESSFLGALVSESLAANGLLRQYVSLFADAISSGDALLSDMMYETQLMKLWTLLETMAIDFNGSKVQKIAGLYNDFQLAIRQNYEGVAGKSHLDVAYALRNVVVHAGGCSAATRQRDIDSCRTYGSMLASIVSELTSDISFIIFQYAARLQQSRLPASEGLDPVSLGDVLKVTIDAADKPPRVEIVPGTSSRTQSTNRGF